MLPVHWIIGVPDQVLQNIKTFFFVYALGHDLGVVFVIVAVLALFGVFERRPHIRSVRGGLPLRLQTGLLHAERRGRDHMGSGCDWPPLETRVVAAAQSPLPRQLEE